jgi:3-oxoacyl-[acyl-carrier-protein] synthase II
MTLDSHAAVITGLGVVAPNGIGKEAFWKGLMDGRSCVGIVSRFNPQAFASHLGAEVPDFQPSEKIPQRHLSYMDRAYQFGVQAALEAVNDAELDFSHEDTVRTGVYMGLAVAGVECGERGFHTIRDEGVAALQPHLYQAWFPSACSGYISLYYGLQGNSQVMSTGCTSSIDALGMALEAIQSGEEDVAIVGGSEAPLTPMPFNSFCSMRALSTRNHDPMHASRPFDRDRDGFVLGEGSAVLVLESYKHAQTRGAAIYGHVAGYGTTSNAFHMTAPEPTGEQSSRAIRLALQAAGLSSERVDYVCAHGSSTPLNEKAETRAIKKALGSHAYQVPVSSIKSMIGHTLGSAGALQTVACALALRRGAIPPTINYEHPDPDCDLDVVPNTARDHRVKVAVINAAGFSGKNSALVIQAI